MNGDEAENGDDYGGKNNKRSAASGTKVKPGGSKWKKLCKKLGDRMPHFPEENLSLINDRETDASHYWMRLMAFRREARDDVAKAERKLAKAERRVVTLQLDMCRFRLDKKAGKDDNENPRDAPETPLLYKCRTATK